MREKPTCGKRTVVARSNLFTVEQMQLTFSNGSYRIYERIKSEGHGAVMIIPVTSG